MIESRKFNIVLVAKGKAAGMDTTEKFDKSVTYSGKKVSVTL